MFESRPQPGEESILGLTHRVYGFLEKEQITWQQVIDMDLSWEYLVVQAQPGSEEQILGRIMGLGLPENTAYYVYKAYEV